MRLDSVHQISGQVWGSLCSNQAIGLEMRGSIPSNSKDSFSLPKRSDPSSWSVGLRGCFPRGVKRSWREVDRSPPSGTGLRMGGAVPPLMAWRGAVFKMHSYVWAVNWKFSSAFDIASGMSPYTTNPFPW